MPTFYNFTENGVVYNFDDVFVPSEYFQEGGLYVWGNASNGVLGNGINSNTNFNIINTNVGIGINWKAVETSARGSMAIKSDGTLWVWGANSLGQLGLGYAGSAISTPTKIDNNINWKTISYYSSDFTNDTPDHAAAIKSDGTLWVWGNNSLSQLGLVGIASTNKPTQVGLSSEWRETKTGFRTTIAIKKDGTLWITGSRNIPGSATTSVFTQVGTSNDWKTAEAGINYAYAIKTDGSLYRWGNLAREGDISANSISTSPVQIGNETNWKQISCIDYTMAVKTDGTLWARGSNTDGQLGLGPSVGVTTEFIQVGSSNNWKRVRVNSSNSSNYTLAIKTDGTLWGTGSNGSRQLTSLVGTGGTTIFTQISTKTNWKDISCGSVHNLAITYEN